jgi:hypothetical protein
VNADWSEDARLVSFPVSSEVALIITDGVFQRPANEFDAVAAINQRTRARGRVFVAGWKEDFPGDECLAEAGNEEPGPPTKDESLP